MSEQQIPEEELKNLREDIRIIGSYMKEFSGYVISEEISEYPVYVAFREEVNLGKPMFRRDQHNLNYDYNASILEEFVQKKIVLRENVEEFMNTFGEADERACIFLISGEDGRFVFIPYDQD